MNCLCSFAFGFHALFNTKKKNSTCVKKQLPLHFFISRPRYPPIREFTLEESNRRLTSELNGDINLE